MGFFDGLDLAFVPGLAVAGLVRDVLLEAEDVGVPRAAVLLAGEQDQVVVVKVGVVDLGDRAVVGDGEEVQPVSGELGVLLEQQGISVGVGYGQDRGHVVLAVAVCGVGVEVAAVPAVGGHREVGVRRRGPRLGVGGRVLQGVLRDSGVRRRRVERGGVLRGCVRGGVLGDPRVLDREGVRRPLRRFVRAAAVQRNQAEQRQELKVSDVHISLPRVARCHRLRGTSPSRRPRPRRRSGPGGRGRRRCRSRPRRSSAQRRRGRRGRRRSSPRQRRRRPCWCAWRP